MPAGQSLDDPIYRAAKQPSGLAVHAGPVGDKSCNQHPHFENPNRGGLLNAALPGAKGTIHNKRRAILGKAKPPSADKPWYFPIGLRTPLLDGTGSGNVRGWVIGSKRKTRKEGLFRVRINWGQRKEMPPPKDYSSSTTKIWYVYAWDVAISHVDPPPKKLEPQLRQEAEDLLTTLDDPDAKDVSLASGWIPEDCIKNSPQSTYRTFLRKLYKCMDKFDKQRWQNVFGKEQPPQPELPTHILRCVHYTKISRLENRFYTRKKKGMDPARRGNASHYVNRTPDSVSPCGYINLCYNLPDFNDVDGVNAGGVACDTFPVGTPFYRIPNAADGKTQLSVKVKLLDKNGKQILNKQHFVYGAVAYIENSQANQPNNGIKYRFGWVDQAALQTWGEPAPFECKLRRKERGPFHNKSCNVDTAVPPNLLNPPGASTF